MPKGKINFFLDESINEKISIDLVDIKSYTTKIIEAYKIIFSEINFRFTDNKTILVFNQEYLNHNYPTDIITFPIEEDPLVADVLISIDQVRLNAIDYNVSFEKEFYRVIAHGFLHLCGFDDKTEQDQIRMREEEEFCLSLRKVSRET